MQEYVKTPFRYPGGKYYALKHLMPFIQQIPHFEYREPFVGGGSIFLGKPHVEFNWINDIEEELINTYQVIQDRDLCRDLVKLVQNEIATRERHTEVKNMNVTTKLERAFKFYYLNRTSYSGIMKKPAWGYRDDKSSPPRNWGAMLLNAHKKLQNVKITNLDFAEVIIKPSKKQVFIYLDPPYFEADQKRAYEKHFVIEDHFRLSEILRSTNHYFALSYDDIETARQLYSWANIIPLEWNYNTSNLKKVERKKGQELLITNFNFQNARIIPCNLGRIKNKAGLDILLSPLS